MGHFFRIIRYKNGKLDYMVDWPKDFKTRERAIESAQNQAEYWSIIHSCAELQKKEDGAFVWYQDSDGNRYRTEFKVINNQ